MSTQPRQNYLRYYIKKIINKFYVKYYKNLNAHSVLTPVDGIYELDAMPNGFARIKPIPSITPLAEFLRLFSGCPLHNKHYKYQVEQNTVNIIFKYKKCIG